MTKPLIKTANKSNARILLTIVILGALHFFMLGKLYSHFGPQEAGKFIAGVVLLLVSFFSMISGINNFRFKRFNCPDCLVRIGRIEPHGKEPGTPFYQFCSSCNILWLVGKAPKRMLAAGDGISDSGADGE
ncbi:hypothetical protein [Microbulbifer sp. ANSA005]|uniref:hypothetical protein n=1 Tax=Microbulbifer sp. ANSA005 TaxID=3243362 RepID=UPI004042A553